MKTEKSRQDLPDSLLPLMASSLRVEAFSQGRTRLKPFHCPEQFLARAIPGINLYENGGIRFERYGYSPVEIQAGDALILPAHQPQRVFNLRPGHTVSIWYSIRLSILDTIDPFDLLVLPVKLPAAAAGKIAELSRVQQGRPEKKERNFLHTLGAQHQLAMELFMLVLAVSKLKPDVEDRVLRRNRIQPVLQYMQRHLGHKLTTALLARRIALSEPRFFEVFRQSTGMSPGKYLQQLRLRKAQELLMTSDLRISEIGSQVGYGDAFHFSRIFKKYSGISPEKFRCQFQSDSSAGH